MKRFFDIVIAAILLILFVPIMLGVVLAIKLDSPGPVLYASPRIGKDGKRFGQLRFRTVRLDKPSYLSMRERLSRVGRFIRNYSLDDLPNLLNILKGDLSIVGPRPTEPERVDLADPIWQRILSVRPGVISPAILQLATQYNASPNSLKQQLELEYVQKRSFGYDLHLFRQALRGFYSSRGNWKARGRPKAVVEYAKYQEKAAPSLELQATNPDDYFWQLTSWDQPDLAYVAAYVQEVGHGWRAGEPQVSLIRCGASPQKAAIFVRLDSQIEWADAIELREIEWLVASTNRYVCVGCLLHFEGAMHQRFVCSTLLDVASPIVENWFTIWRQSPETVVFLVKHDLTEIQYCHWASNRADKEGAKAQAIRQWEEVKTRLQESGFALENFAEESQLLRGTLLRW